jgi:hypothetical protein
MRWENLKKRAPLLTAAAKYALFACVLVLVCRALVRQFASIEWQEIQFCPFYIVLTALAAFAGRSLSVLAYRSILGGFGAVPPWRESMCIAWVPPMGKYIPGKVATVLGAVWLLRRHDVPGPVAGVAVFLLMGLRVLVGLLIACPLMLWAPIRSSLPMAWIWCVGLLLAGTFCLHPRVFGSLFAFLGRKLKRQRFPEMRGLGGYAGSVAVMFAQCFVVGLALWFVTKSITDLSAWWIPVFIGANALATSLGFLAFFAPAGLGVREGILLMVFSLVPDLGPGTGAVAVVAMRFTYTIVEVILAAIGLVILRWFPTHVAQDTDSHVERDRSLGDRR